jgi:5-formyltetrahydrofolate cyclo-ligase
MEDVATWRRARRTELIARRMAIPVQQRAAWSAAIADHLVAALAKMPPGVLGFYWPIRGEFDPRKTVMSLLEREWRAALPVVVGKDIPLEYRDWTPDSVMERGALGIMVPREGAPVLPDVVLAPLVGYDGDRYRLGNGGGYFDRTLADLDPPPLAIGIGFTLCRIDSIRPQPHDKPMDMIVTEEGVLS